MKRSRKIITVFLMGLLLGGGGCFFEKTGGDAFAQQQDWQKRREEIKAMKIAFFTDALKLTPQESEKFWPVYNQYWGELREIGRRRRELLQTVRTGAVGEKELTDWGNIMTAERDLVRKYGTRFKEVLPIDKIVRVFVADENFKNHLIRRREAGITK